MRVSTKGRYGIRACLELAGRYGRGAVRISEIARAQDVPEKYLAQIIPTLRKSGMVKSVRGARGGYMLSRPPGEIRMGEIVESLEGSVAPVECVMDPPACGRVSHCPARVFWLRVRDSLWESMNSLSLEDLLKMESEKGPESFIYDI